MLEIQNLRAGYPGRNVLENISLSCPEGQLTVVIGPNGCGKSTLLKAVAGLLPSEGNILLDGADLRGMIPARRGQNIAFLPQNRSVPEITAGRLVLHGRFPYLSYPRRYSSADETVAREAMEQLEIGHLAERQMTSLSGGERQKVYIAMVLAQQTPVVLLDEPTSFLDIAHKFEVIHLAEDLKRRGKTVIMVLHDLDLALNRADRIVVMEAGHVRMSACPDEIFESGILRRVFRVRPGRLRTEEGYQYYFQPETGGYDE